MLYEYIDVIGMYCAQYIRGVCDMNETDRYLPLPIPDHLDAYSRMGDQQEMLTENHDSSFRTKVRASSVHLRCLAPRSLSLCVPFKGFLVTSFDPPHP